MENSRTRRDDRALDDVALADVARDHPAVGDRGLVERVRDGNGNRNRNRDCRRDRIRKGVVRQGVVLALAFLGCGAGSALAANPGPCAAAELELTAQASAREINDEMAVNLVAERTGQDVGDLNQQVLRLVRAGLDAAAGTSGVKARAGSVTTEPQWDGNGRRNGWRVVASLVLEGRDLAATGELAGRLARDLQLAGVEYRLSGPRRAQVENRLIEEAAQAFRERARLAAVALGFHDYVLGKVVVQTQPASLPPPRTLRMAADAASAAVPAEGGEATVDVSITGTVRLR